MCPYCRRRVQTYTPLHTAVYRDLASDLTADLPAEAVGQPVEAAAQEPEAVAKEAEREVEQTRQNAAAGGGPNAENSYHL